MIRMLSSIVLILVTTAMLAQSKEDKGGSIGPRLEVQITSDKSVYKVGEPVRITITLRNEGNVVVWLSKPLGVGRDPGYFYVDAVAPDGTLLRNTSPVTGGGMHEPPKRSANSVLQEFLCHRVPFFPGEFWGVSRNIDDAFVALRSPGRYKITAKYLDEPIHDLSKATLQKLQMEAKFPIQTEPVASEPLVIEIEAATADSGFR
jgi:hypothetical protein